MSAFASHDSATKQSAGDAITAEEIAEAVRNGEVKTRDDVRRVIEETGTETPDR